MKKKEMRNILREILILRKNNKKIKTKEIIEILKNKQYIIN